jgi:uncharacterized protein YciI
VTYYAVELIPVDQTPLSPDLIRRHAEHLREIDQAGKLVMGGPFPEDSHGLVVLKCNDRDEAARILDIDPLITGGVRTYRVRTWLIATAEKGYMP